MDKRLVAGLVLLSCAVFLYGCWVVSSAILKVGIGIIDITYWMGLTRWVFVAPIALMAALGALLAYLGLRGNA